MSEDTNATPSPWLFRLTLLAAAWLGACFLLLLLSGGAVLEAAPIFWIFPSGLSVVMLGVENNHGLLSTVIGWLIYAGLAIAMLFCKRNMFWFLYAILLVLLVVNVRGCQTNIQHLGSMKG